MKDNINSYEFFIQTEKKHIDFINKIMEAYEGLGIVRTIDPKAGKIKIITLEIYKKEIDRILEDLNKKGIGVEVTEEGIWKGEI